MRFTDFPQEIQQDIKDYILAGNSSPRVELLHYVEQFDGDIVYYTAIFSYSGKWYSLEAMAESLAFSRRMCTDFDATLHIPEITSYEKQVTITVTKPN